MQDQDIIRQQAHEKHLDPALIAAVIYAETKFDPRPSSAGRPGADADPAARRPTSSPRRSGATTFTTADLATPQVNIAYGSYYLRYLLDSYGGNTMLALAAYNGGQANVDRWVAARQGTRAPADEAEIPFPETRDVRGQGPAGAARLPAHLPDRARLPVAAPGGADGPAPPARRRRPRAARPGAAAPEPPAPARQYARRGRPACSTPAITDAIASASPALERGHRDPDPGRSLDPEPLAGER